MEAGKRTTPRPILPTSDDAHHNHKDYRERPGTSKENRMGKLSERLTSP